MRIMLGYLARFITSTGGAEKVCCEMANELVRRGHEVSIVYSYGESGRPFYPLDQTVRMYNVMAEHPEKWNGAKTIRLPLKEKVEREIFRVFSVPRAHGVQDAYTGNLVKEDLKAIVERENPDVIISYWPKDSSCFINFAKIQVPVITMFHFGPDILARDASPGSAEACVKSRKVQVLLPGDIERLHRYIPKADAVWIPHAVPQYEEQADLSASKERYKIVNMARLDKTTKRQHIIVEAFARIADQFPQWDVELWGQDWNKKYKKELENLIRKNHLEKRIFLKGLTKDVLTEYLKADIFAWPSAHEGFGLALMEAMSAGLPVVACKSCLASAELIPKECGILAEDGIGSFADGLTQLMANQDLRVRMGAAAKENAGKYAPGKIWNQWEQLITSCTEMKK